jgi:hypothetical protein
MGFLDNVAKFLDKVSDTPAPEARGSMPELPPPPAGRVRGIAVLVESQRALRGDANDAQGLGGQLLDRARGIAYDFVLRVTIPGQAPYQVSKADRVPAKFEDGGLFGGAVHLAAGIEVPVVVATADPTDVEIDWAAYELMPGRAEDAELASNRKAWAAMAVEFQKQPAAQREYILSSGRDTALTFARLVVSGQMQRSQFDDAVDMEFRSGRLRSEDLQEALAIIAAGAPPEVVTPA